MRIQRYFLSLLLMGLTAGCNSSSPTSPGNGEAGEATPANVLQQMVEAYHEAGSYQDSGELIFRGVVDGEQQEDQPLPFSLAFERPNKLRLHRFGALLSIDGTKRYGAVMAVGGVPGIPGQVLATPAPLELTPDNLAGDPSLGEALSWDLGEVDRTRLRLLLRAKPVEADPEFAAEATFQEEAFLEDRPCYCIRVPRGEDASRTYWIDKESYVLRRLEIESPELKKKLDAAGVFSKLAARMEFTGATLDADVPAEAFQFEVPADAVQVRELIAPVNAPNPYLGKQIPAFRLVDLEGNPVTPEEWKDKIVVLDFWFTTCAPCQESMPKLEALYEAYKGNDRVRFYAVSIDPSTVDDQHVAKTIRDWGASVPVLRDPEAFHQSSFAIPGAPSMFILDGEQKVQAFKAGITPNHDDFQEVIQRLLAGENVAQNALDTYQKLQAKFDQELEAASVQPKTQTVEILQTKIAPESEPETLVRKQIWQAEAVEHPGNLMVVGDDEQQHIYALDGLRSVVELSAADGKLIKRHKLKIPDTSGVSFFRTAADSQGQRYFLASASRQNQVHLFDGQWNLTLSYPQDEDVLVGDAQLADINGNGKLEMVIGYWGIVGVQAVALDGERQWSNRTLENVVELDITQPDDDGRRTVLCVSTRGSVVPIDARGQQLPDQVVANRAVIYVATSDLNGDGTSERCALVAVPGKDGQVEAIGLDDQGQPQWTYPLPAGFMETAIERIVPAPLGNGDGGWLIPAADGSIHLLTEAGQLVDRFNYGAKLTGLTLYSQQSEPVLVVATADSLIAWRLSPK